MGQANHPPTKPLDLLVPVNEPMFVTEYFNRESNPTAASPWLTLSASG